MDKLERYLLEYTDGHPVWLDETRILFTSNRAGSPQMWEKNLESGEVKQRTFFNSKVVNIKPYRAGKQILFTLDTNGSENEQPFIIGYDDTEPVALIERPSVLHRSVPVPASQWMCLIRVPMSTVRSRAWKRSIRAVRNGPMTIFTCGTAAVPMPAATAVWRLPIHSAMSHSVTCPAQSTIHSMPPASVSVIFSVTAIIP